MDHIERVADRADRRRARWWPAVAVVGALAVAACGSGGGSTTTDASGAAPGASGEAAGVSFPVVVEGANGRVEIAARPERIVSLSASLTEMLFAIDAGDQVEAVDAYSNYPEEAPVTDLSAFRPNVEAVAAYDPDLVVLSSEDPDVVESFEQLAIPTVVLPSAGTLDELDQQLKALGDATGHPEEAAAVIDTMDDEIDALVAEVPERDEPLTYYFEVSDTYHSVTSDTFIGEILGLAGLTSIADAAGGAEEQYPQLSAEAIVDADPDLILVARGGVSGDDVSTDDIAARPGWETLSAVTGDDVVILDADSATRWGPRVVEALRRVVDATREM